MTEQPVKLHQFEDVECFISALSLTGPIFFDEPDTRKVVFRGHGNADWKLLPFLFRNIASPNATENGLRWVPLVRQEAQQLKQFVEIADRRGLAVPGESVTLRQELNTCSTGDYSTFTFESFVRWPKPEILPALAMGQHHGMPTRLLDWSFNPLVAAYFAAKEAIRLASLPEKCPAYFCVWGMDGLPISIQDPYVSSPSRSFFETVSVPRAQNPNLFAQEGVFLLGRQSVHYSDPPALPFDEGLCNGFVTGNVELHKLVLPLSCAGKLLWRLALLGIDGAALFPGFDGVVRSVAERQSWERS